MIYLITFLGSAVFYYIALRRSDAGSKYRLYLVLAAALPIMLAALREEHVGTDILWYLKGLYLDAGRATNLLPYLIRNSGIEFLFLLLVYHLTKLFGSIFVLQGMIQLLVIVPVFYVIWKNRKRSDPILSLIVFFFLFYINSLNIMRQSIAMSFCLLAFLKFEEKKYWQAVVFEVIAIGFHRTAIINFFLIGIYMLMKSSIRKIYSWMILIVLVGILLNYERLIIILAQVIHIIPEKYINAQYFYGSKNFAMSDVILYSINLFVLYLLKDDDREWADFIKVISVVSFLSIYLSYSAGTIARIAMYWNYYLIFSMPQFEKIIAKNMFSTFMFYVLFFLFLLAYWLYNFVFLGYSEAYPYRFGIF